MENLLRKTMRSTNPEVLKVIMRKGFPSFYRVSQANWDVHQFRIDTIYARGELRRTHPTTLFKACAAEITIALFLTGCEHNIIVWFAQNFLTRPIIGSDFPPGTELNTYSQATISAVNVTVNNKRR